MTIELALVLPPLLSKALQTKGFGQQLIAYYTHVLPFLFVGSWPGIHRSLWADTDQRRRAGHRADISDAHA
jgi:hypothetical protein